MNILDAHYSYTKCYSLIKDLEVVQVYEFKRFA